MIEKILELKKESSLYNIALDIGISESSLYGFIHKRPNISEKVITKIRTYLKGVSL